ncbi:MAG: sensor histidine kinase [Gemmatimonadales bacterium]
MARPADLTHTAPRPLPVDEAFTLSPRERLLIAAFWLLYALLTIASRVFDTGAPRVTWTSGPVIVALVESVAWALLTPVVFRLAAGYGGTPERRRTSVARFVVLGMAIAALLGFGGRELRMALFTPPPGLVAERAATGQRFGPPIWFGFLNAFVIYLGVLAAGLARAYSLRYQARQQQAAELQARLVEAQLDALRRQLDPHFLFNTLNAVSSLVERDPRGVRRMIARLSELLRYHLEAQDGPEIPLRKELELLGRYLDIMQVRFQGRLDVRQAVEEDTLDALVPSMMLQPLVENAIRHGVEKLEAGGRIAIEAAAEDGELVIRVSDNGPGPRANPLEASGDRADGLPGGVGLRNTVARLAQLYGARGQFSLLPSAAGEGATAEIRLPFRRARVG